MSLPLATPTGGSQCSSAVWARGLRVPRPDMLPGQPLPSILPPLGGATAASSWRAAPRATAKASSGRSSTTWPTRSRRTARLIEMLDVLEVAATASMSGAGRRSSAGEAQRRFTCSSPQRVLESRPDLGVNASWPWALLQISPLARTTPSGSSFGEPRRSPAEVLRRHPAQCPRSRDELSARC